MNDCSQEGFDWRSYAMNAMKDISHVNEGLLEDEQSEGEGG
jgi:hypothetical protein